VTPVGTRGLVAGWIAWSCLLTLGAACGGDDGADRSATAQPSAKPAAAKPAAADEASRPPSERLLGRWKMELAKVPDTALTKELREMKKEGTAAKVRVEYTITASEFTMDKWGPGGRVRQKWHYEILKELDDSLLLKRLHEDSGEGQEVPAEFRNGALILGTDAGKVSLQRIE